MSNLSELLPTGGGQNAVNFVASGTLSSGQTVALKSDGTVEAVEGASQELGSEVVFEPALTSSISVTFDSNSNKIVVAYYDGGNSNYGTAIVGTVSGTSISFGSPVVFNSANTPRLSVTFDSNSNKVVIAYKDDGNSSYGTAIVGTVSGTSISFGSEVVFNTASTTTIGCTFDSNLNKVVIGYTDEGNSEYGTAIVGTVSGTSISFGSESVFNSAGTFYPYLTFDSNSNKVVISYYNAGNSAYGTAIVGTVSGTSISFGSAVVYNSSASTDYVSITFDSTANKVVIVFRDAGNSGRGTAIVGDVSGTSISFGSKVVFQTSSSTYVAVTFDSTANKIVVAFRGPTSTFPGTFRTATVSGTSIIFDPLVIFNNASTERISITFDSTTNKVVTAYQDQGNSNYGTAVVFQVPFTNVTDFIGITAGAISDTATGTVNVYGGINEAQTGLTIGADYYVQDDGSLSTTASSVKVGQAISATTINMMDLT